MDVENTLKSAIQAARAGETAQARSLLAAIVRQAPDHFEAWLWLSELANTFEAQTRALERAQALCPPDASGQRDLQVHLDRLHRLLRGPGPSGVTTQAGTKQEIRRQLVQAERLANIGKREEAVQLLARLAETQPQDERVWLLLSEVHSDPQEKYRALEKVLAINPQHTGAAARLEALRPVQQNPLQRGQSLEEAGQFAEALELYQTITVHSPNPTDRIEARRRMDAIHLRQEADQAQPVHPTLNLLRMTAGPGLLFALMVFIQSGLKLLRLPLLALPGLLSVLAGSLLVSVTGMRPMHPKWIERYGAPGSPGELKTRLRLRWLGWLFLLAPFLLFFIEAGFRLLILRDALLASAP